MRRDYAEFARRGVEILAVGPDDHDAFKAYWARENIPFPGLADPRHTVADSYEQEVNLLKLGRMPALLIVDKEGRVRHQYYSSSMSDIPTNPEVLTLLDELNTPAAGQSPAGLTCS